MFKDITSKEILIWKHIDSELVFDYKQQLEVLLNLRYKVQAIIIDGKRGLYKAFKDYETTAQYKNNYIPLKSFT